MTFDRRRAQAVDHLFLEQNLDAGLIGELPQRRAERLCRHIEVGLR
jgi:hypothetical protein